MADGFEDLRDFVAELESRGQVVDVQKEVDPRDELACIARWAIDSMTERTAYAIRFPRVRGHREPVVLNLLGSWAMIARSLGTSRSDLLPRWSRALASPQPPREVAEGPAQQVVWDRDIDVRRFPCPVWTPGRDRSPYLVTAGVITRPRGGGPQNLGTYRVEVQGATQLGLSFGSERQHGAMHLRTWEDAGEAMPVAIVLGMAPAVGIAAGAKVRYGVDEVTVAGGLLGRPISVVAATCSDLRVPAHAEIVIEGRVRPGVRGPEGPFGEALGYMESRSNAPVVDVECVTHRRDPLVHGLVQQLPTTEGHRLQEFGLLGSVWHYLHGRVGATGVADLGIVPGAAGVSMIAISVRRGDRGSVDAVLGAMKLMSWGQKLVVVVDDDIDVRDPVAINWALTSRVDFGRDIEVQPDVPLYQRDPSIIGSSEGPKAAEGFRGAKLLVDATRRGDGMVVALPSTSRMEAVRGAWAETGLPPLNPSAALERLLEAHADAGAS